MGAMLAAMKLGMVGTMMTATTSESMQAMMKKKGDKLLNQLQKLQWKYQSLLLWQ